MHPLLSREASAPPVHHARRCGHRGLAPLAVAMLSLCLVNPVMAEQPSLTLQTALDAAQARSATLQAQHAAARAAREMAVASGRLPDPVLRLSIDNLRTFPWIAERETAGKLTLTGLQLIYRLNCKGKDA